MAPTAASQAAVAQASATRQQAVQLLAHSEHAQASLATSSNNPLRSQVVPAAYQVDTAQVPLPSTGAQLPELPGAAPGNSSVAPPNSPAPLPYGQPDFEAPLPPATGNLPPSTIDPLDQPEMPPPPTARGSAGDNAPGSILEDPRPANPFPPPREDRSPADRGPELLPQPPATGNGETSPPGELRRRQQSATSGYCDDIRARILANPITAVSLDVSPAYGAGFRGASEAEQSRLDFAASAPVRQWTDYRGQALGRGRMIDLRDGRVVIDVDGREQAIPFRDLSDVDIAYVGEAWNIPEQCGTGYDPLRGRDFVPSTVQWAASGLCHKPLYFEQVQLERYGHELGPILQPLVSSAHFFGSIPLLPYKMGIHPPNECQYALGYYRPGSCAPYMLQPIPWSLRGAAVQAAAVTGGAALIP